MIPDGVRDAIGSRLSRLSGACNQVLGAASVIGREFDFSLLDLLHPDMKADDVLAAFDEALEGDRRSAGYRQVSVWACAHPALSVWRDVVYS